MFLIKCLICGKQTKIKITSKQGKAVLVFFGSDGKDEGKEIIVYSTAHEEVKIACPNCDNEIGGK